MHRKEPLERNRDLMGTSWNINSYLPKVHNLMKGTDAEGEWFCGIRVVSTGTTGQNGGSGYIKQAYWEVILRVHGKQVESVWISLEILLEYWEKRLGTKIESNFFLPFQQFLFPIGCIGHGFFWFCINLLVAGLAFLLDFIPSHSTQRSRCTSSTEVAPGQGPQECPCMSHHMWCT